MIRRIVPLFVVALLSAGLSSGRPDDEKKTDGQIEVKEGTEFKLTKDTITLDKEAEDEGRFPVTVKAGEAKTLKMPAQKRMLGFYANTAKKDKIEVESALENSPLQDMRTQAKMAKERGGWMIDPGDVITHVNGYAVKTMQELICAVNAAEDHEDLQLVVKDVGTGKQYAFWVSTSKK